MTGAITFLFSFAEFLPWVAIALMAGLALRKNRESKTLMMQAVGASASFVLAIGRWVLVSLLGTLGAKSGTIYWGVNTIFSFLIFVALTVFAVGYCLERFRRRTAAEVGPVQVSARPVD